MTQLHLFYPPKLSVDQRVDEKNSITYLGDAHYSHGDGFYVCLANVQGALCRRVEIRVSL